MTKQFWGRFVLGFGLTCNLFALGAGGLYLTTKATGEDCFDVKIVREQPSVEIQIQQEQVVVPLKVYAQFQGALNAYETVMLPPDAHLILRAVMLLPQTVDRKIMEYRERLFVQEQQRLQQEEKSTPSSS